MDHSSVDHSATTGDSIDPYQKLNGALSVDYSEATIPLQAPASGAGDGLAAGHAIDASTMMTPDALAGGIGSRLPPDSAETVHEMHLALLYLLSNPQEFNKALTFEVGGSGASMQD